MSIKDEIGRKLNQAFNVEYLSVVDESHFHSVPEGAESHFQVILVSPDFIGKTRIARQRLVNEVLKDELRASIHALSQKALTPEEWKNQKNESMVSPKCMGGSKS